MINLLKKPYKKKASKFQPFKKLFAKRKKREATSNQEDSKLKPSSSFGNVCNGALSSDEETNNGLRTSNYSMGTRAFSHDSIFIPDGRAESEESIEAMSQDNIVGKVKSLQLGGLMDSVSPSGLHKTRHEGEEKVTPIKSSSRPKRHHSPSGTIETVDLDAIPLAIARLDNSAAKHKLSVKPKNQRVSKKHRRLSKELQSVKVTEFQPGIPESLQDEDKVSQHNSHLVADKPIHLREGQEQKAEGKGNQENHWVNIETEKKIQMAEAKVKSFMEPRGLQESEEHQREQERKKQKFQEEQLFKIEERKVQEGERHQECPVQRHKGEDEKGGKEEELQERGGHPQAEDEPQEQEEEKQRHQELEAQMQQGGHRDHEPEAGQQRKEENLCELEAQRQWEKQNQQEPEAQKEQEEQERCELEAQRQWREQKQSEFEEQKIQEEQKQCELEAQRQQEGKNQYEQEARKQKQCELEAQRQEEQRHCELEAQKLQEKQRQSALKAQRQWEEQRQHDLEIQGQQKEQKQCELEAQQLQEEQSQCTQGTQGTQDELRQRELEEQKQQAKKSRQEEIEDKKPHEKLLLQGWKETREDLEKQKQQEGTQGHQDWEEKRGRGVEEETHKAEKRDELSQQVLQLQKTGQRQKALEKQKALEGKEKLQGKDSATNLGKQRRPRGQQENLEARQMSKDEEKQQEPKKQIRSPEYGKCESAKLKQSWDEKNTRPEERIQREGDQKLDEEKTLSLEGQPIQEKPKEQDKTFQQRLDKNVTSEETHTETVKTELPLKERVSQQQMEQADKDQRKEGTLKSSQRRNIEAQEQERILGEELRWQEVDARQTMPRGFTFQVSSGEKQIIFQKVNLSPVTPAKEPPVSSDTKELKTLKSGKGSHDLPSSLYVPHTAILVTGAQLCGTAVNLNQIKDTACKSLLGLTEERKMVDVAPPENTQKLSPEAKPSSSKMKPAEDPSGNQAVLAEWASIRSKILKTAENGKLHEKDKGSLSRHSDDWTSKGRSTPHGNLRKTLSANAKFSITPAWQKFSEVSKSSTGAESRAGTVADNTTRELGPSTVHSNREAVHAETVSGTVNVHGSPVGKPRVHHEVADNTEGCKFAKDLPSFLVPSATCSLSKEMPQSETSDATETPQNISTRKLDKASPNGEENISPFGVKLRRTNYSLRFHYDQQAEQKKKKRYSAGDSFDGVPTPLVTPDSEQDPINIFLKASKSPSQERKDTISNSVKASSVNTNQSYITGGLVPTCSHGSAPSQEKPICKSPLPQKPALAPKPTSQTPPSSPLLKIRRPMLTESSGQKQGKTESGTSWRKMEAKGSTHLSQTPEERKNEEEESKEKKSFFPSIPMPWREKAEKKPEPPKKDRPVLQSRHSIDGSKLVEKVESAQPLWITLALQKQKGFREQQATREERRQAREAKQAEKLAKEPASINHPSDSKNTNTSRTSALLKTPAQEEKKIETATSRLERREQLKKSNTLPTSVTVEISDSVPSSPLAKEVTKRFSTPDANPVSTEPAWLALAKRKAKAWSDCPQIIK
ncbi:capping protein-inhibiting regulator of actin dynamics isoform X2 [Pogona vitticeps]